MKRNPRIREIAAAWAFGAMLAIGAFVGETSATRDDPSITAYAGAHLPGAGGARGPAGNPTKDGMTTRSQTRRTALHR